MKKALITGITGQDGAYLAELLLQKGYKVYGGIRRTSTINTWRLDRLGITNNINLVSFDLSDYVNIYNTIKSIMPDEIYNLAAQSFVGTSFEQPLFTADVNASGVTRILESIRAINPDIRFYQASTSEMFGKITESIQKETTPFYPRSPYGVSKVYGHWITINYRESYNIYACSGILFNHESPLRGEEFVTRKITKGLKMIKQGKQAVLELGNLDAKRDWGFAKDYVEGMHLMLQQDSPDDYVLATGKTTTVREFATIACHYAGFEIEWQGTGMDEIAIDKKTGKTIIKINQIFHRPAEVDILIGDPTKAKEILKWEPKTNLEELVKMMVEGEVC